MRLSWSEIRSRAEQFAQNWRDARNERGKTYTFSNDFFEVTGISRRSNHFGLAAAALLADRVALLGAHLLTAVLFGFRMRVWLPTFAAHLSVLGNWTGTAQTSAIASAFWLVNDCFAASHGSLFLDAIEAA